MKKFNESPEFLKLNAEWQQRLEDDGFHDIERTHNRRTGEGRTHDYNERPWSTERAVSLNALVHPASGDEPENWETLIQDEQSSLTDGFAGDIVSTWDLPAARYFRVGAQVLAQLPSNHPHLAYLREYVETGVYREGDMLRRHSLTHKRARRIVAAFEKLMRKSR